MAAYVLVILFEKESQRSAVRSTPSRYSRPVPVSINMLCKGRVVFCVPLFFMETKTSS